MNLRITALAVLIGIGLLAIGFRAYRLQVAQSQEFLDRALENQSRAEEIPAPRGKFLDRLGRVLGESRKSIDVYLLDPSRVPSGEALERLSRVLGISKDELRRKLPQRRRVGYYIPNQLKEEIGQRAYVRLLEDRIHLPGIVPRDVEVRHYLYETLACHLLGRVGRIGADELDHYMSLGYSPGEVIGVAGLEKKFQDVLRGRRGIRSLQVDALGWPKGERLVSPASPGGDVTLSIDLDVQLATERALGSRRGSVAVVVPETGDILALASAPRFDPNHFHRKVSADEWLRLSQSWTAPLLNRATEASYQPGSTFKVLTALAALDGGVDPQETVHCTGRFELGPRVAKCWKKNGHGDVAMVQAIAHSCNVYFYTMGLRAGIERIEKVGRAFGLGERTGIDVGGETPGVLPGPEYRKQRHLSVWTKGDTINVAIGQGEVLTTPLQMARVMGAIENHGVLMKSRLVRTVRSEDGGRSYAPEERSRLEVKPDQLETVLEGMRWAVRQGTAVRTRIPGLDIYGKTGSAQNPAGDTHAWFVGVMRAPGGSVAIAVALENAGGGGKEAAPVAKEVFQAVLEAGWGEESSAQPTPLVTSVARAPGTTSRGPLEVEVARVLDEAELTPPEEVEDVPDTLAIFDPGGGHEGDPAPAAAAGPAPSPSPAPPPPAATARPPSPPPPPTPSPPPSVIPTPAPAPPVAPPPRRPRPPRRVPPRRPAPAPDRSGFVDPSSISEDLAPLGPPPSLR